MLLLVVYNGIIPTPSFMSNQLKFKVMVNKLVKKCSVKLNSRKQICLCFGNSTPFCIEGKAVDFTNYSSEERKKLSDLCLPTLTQYFHAKTYFDENIPPTLRHKWNLQLSKFVEDCNEALFKFPELQTKKAKEIALFVLGGCKSESLNAKQITLGEFIDIVIERQTNKNLNPESLNFTKYITLKNALKLWDNGSILERNISSITQNDLLSFSNFIMTGKGGNNHYRLLTLFRAIMGFAIDNTYNINTGCTEDNRIKVTKELKEKTEKATYKNDWEASNDTEEKTAITLEQMDMFFNFDISTITIKYIPNPKRINKTTGLPYECTMGEELKALYFDIAKLELATGGRPIDIIRLKIDHFDFQKREICYTPKKNLGKRTNNKKWKKGLLHFPFNDMVLSVYNKYKNCNANGYLFPVRPNTHNYKNPIALYGAINHVESFVTKVIRAICNNIGVSFDAIGYTMRKSSITGEVDEMFEDYFKNVIAPKLAIKYGTGEGNIMNIYYQRGINGIARNI